MTITGVNPVPALSSSGSEIKVPFQIDSCTGAVAVLTDQLQIIDQHIVSLINTMHRERLMLPTYGGNAPAHVFDVNDPSSMAFLQKDIEGAILSFEPSVQHVSVVVTPSAIQSSVVNVTITYTYAPLSDINELQISVGGAIVEVISP